jgi:hypothetical protein
VVGWKPSQNRNLFASVQVPGVASLQRMPASRYPLPQQACLVSVNPAAITQGGMAHRNNHKPQETIIKSALEIVISHACILWDDWIHISVYHRPATVSFHVVQPVSQPTSISKGISENIVKICKGFLPHSISKLFQPHYHVHPIMFLTFKLFEHLTTQECVHSLDWHMSIQSDATKSLVSSWKDQLEHQNESPENRQMTLMTWKHRSVTIHHIIVV